MNDQNVIREAEGELERLRLIYARKVAAAEKIPGDLQQWAERRLSQARDAEETRAQISAGGWRHVVRYKLRQTVSVHRFLAFPASAS